MKVTTDSEKNSVPTGFGSKWLLWANGILISFIFLLLLFFAVLWFSDRILSGMMNQVISPRLTRLVEKNPDLLFNLSKIVTPQSLGLRTNRLLEKDPQWLSRLVKSIDPVLMAGALNQVCRENPEQISLLLKNLDARSLSALHSHLLKNNRTLLVAWMTAMDHRALGAVVVETLSKDPRSFSKLVEGLQPAPLSRSINTLLRDEKVFLSALLGTLDMGSLAALIDKIAKEHPEFMNELVDKIIELIRKDFMKGGIY